MKRFHNKDIADRVWLERLDRIEVDLKALGVYNNVSPDPSTIKFDMNEYLGK